MPGGWRESGGEIVWIVQRSETPVFMTLYGHNDALCIVPHVKHKRVLLWKFQASDLPGVETRNSSRSSSFLVLALLLFRWLAIVRLLSSLHNALRDKRNECQRQSIILFKRVDAFTRFTSETRKVADVSGGQAGCFTWQLSFRDDLFESFGAWNGRITREEKQKTPTLLNRFNWPRRWRGRCRIAAVARNVLENYTRVSCEMCTCILLLSS